MQFTKRKPPSAAETRLSAAQADKAAAEAEMEAARVIMARLEAQARCAAPIAAEIALLDRDDSAAMSQWASNPNGNAAPAPDAERRADLQKRLAAAEAQVRSAQGAMGGPRAAMNAAGQRAAVAQRAAWIASKLIAIDEAEATLDPLKNAIAQIYECKRRVDSARESVLAGLSIGEDTREIFIALSAFDHKRIAAESKPLSEVLPPDGIVPDGQHELARALAQLGPATGPNWDVGAPRQDEARVGLFR